MLSLCVSKLPRVVLTKMTKERFTAIAFDLMLQGVQILIQIEYLKAIYIHSDS